jgi:hypothetical protein
MKEIIFLSGPITGTPDYTSRFAMKEYELHKAGKWVINPAKVCAQIQPHEMFDHDAYLDVTLSMLKNCTTLYLMKGWDDSEGCLAELRYAITHGLTIEFEDMNDARLLDVMQLSNYYDNPSLDTACSIDLCMVTDFRWLDPFYTLFVVDEGDDGKTAYYYIPGEDILDSEYVPWDLAGGVIQLARPLKDYLR